MKIDNDTKKQLTIKYRTDLYETDDIDLDEIDDSIDDNELKTMIQINNADMFALKNEKPVNKDLIRRLLVANINFYKLAKSRGISVHGTSFLMNIAGVVDYPVDKLYAELSVGEYNRPYQTR